MDNKTAIHVKKEEINEVNESGTLFPEDQLRTENTKVHIKKEPEAKWDTDSFEHNLLEDPFMISWYADHIKEDPELILEVDGPENIEVTQETRAPYFTRLTKSASEARDILVEQKCLQEITCDKLKMASEKLAHFVGTGTPTNLFDFHEHKALRTKNYYRIKKSEFKDYNCNSCKRHFSSKYKLIMHVFSHIEGVEPPIHTCTWCGEVFRTSRSLNKHSVTQPEISREEHDLGRISSLQTYDEVCTEQIPNKFKFCNSLLSTVDTVNQCRSDVNGKNVTQSSQLKLSLTHSRKRQYRCNACGKCFIQLAHLKTHSLIHTGEALCKCDICGKYISTSGNLRRHMLTHSQRRPHKCDVCEKSFKTTADLRRHASLHTGEKLHKCNTCGKRFRGSGDVKQHMLVHTGEKPHKCDVCGKSFQTSGNLYKHILIHTGAKPHKCHVCGKCFRLRGGLKTHSSMHTNERPYDCDICGKSFKRSGDLNSHALIHSGKKPHKCDVCGKYFRLLHELKRHKFIHNGERPYKCNTCGKGFTGVGNRNQHMLTHTRVRPHKCTVCGKSCTTSGNLKKHALTHTDDRPHKCKVCGKYLKTDGERKRHSLIHTRY